MKKLYVRLVLWLIAPALEEQRRREAERPPEPVPLPASVSVPPGGDFDWSRLGFESPPQVHQSQITAGTLNFGRKAQM